MVGLGVMGRGCMMIMRLKRMRMITKRGRSGRGEREGRKG